MDVHITKLLVLSGHAESTVPEKFKKQTADVWTSLLLGRLVQAQAVCLYPKTGLLMPLLVFNAANLFARITQVIFSIRHTQTFLRQNQFTTFGQADNDALKTKVLYRNNEKKIIYSIGFRTLPDKVAAIGY